MQPFSLVIKNFGVLSPLGIRVHTIIIIFHFVDKYSHLVKGELDADVLPIPRCYFTRCEGRDSSKEDMIIMENLEERGFVFITNGDDEDLNKAHVEIVIREIAKLHAISYCLKVSLPLFQ